MNLLLQINKVIYNFLKYTTRGLASSGELMSPALRCPDFRIAPAAAKPEQNDGFI